MVPKEFKDVSGWLESIPENERHEKLRGLIDSCSHTIDPPPLYTAEEMETRYIEFVRNLPKKTFHMARFLPRFNRSTKGLMPGELVMLMGDTSVGKTATMQAIARAAAPLPTLFFELELPLELMFQRQVQMELKCKEEDVINDYQNNAGKYAERFQGMSHILTCDKSGITMEGIEILIGKSELKFGAHPVVVMIDYMGLVKKNNARSRYEGMADAAEQAKVIARRTGTVVIMGSQIGRPDDRVQVRDVKLHHAKGAGELENSSNLVIGISRPEANKISYKILKNTRGPIGDVIDCDFDGETMQIKDSPIAI
jgi:replicative DNA helicase